MSLRTPALLFLLLASTQAQAQDGESLFRQHCAACHTMEPGMHRLGPSLAALDGRVSGEAPGFAYSDALLTAAIRWDAAALDAFLADPAGVAPGNRMIFQGLADPAGRAALIGYLLTE